jgi:hypothetical protein
MMAAGAVLTAIVMNLLNNNSGLSSTSSLLVNTNNNNPASSAATATSSRAVEERSSSSSSSISAAGGASVQVVVDGIEPAEGWHPIHVFYGKMNHLLDPIPVEKFWVPLENHASQKGGSLTTVLAKQKNREWFSQHGQDVAVMKALDFPENAFFVDLAANDAVWASNTFVMEQSFGWKGKDTISIKCSRLIRNDTIRYDARFVAIYFFGHDIF